MFLFGATALGLTSAPGLALRAPLSLDLWSVWIDRLALPGRVRFADLQLALLDHRFLRTVLKSLTGGSETAPLVILNATPKAMHVMRYVTGTG